MKMFVRLSLALVALFLFGLMGCDELPSETGHDNPNDPDSPEYSYDPPPELEYTLDPNTTDLNKPISLDCSGAESYRIDWENDGSWDLDWTTSGSFTHTYTSTGFKTIRVAYRDSQLNTYFETLPVVQVYYIYESFDGYNTGTASPDFPSFIEDTEVNGSYEISSTHYGNSGKSVKMSDPDLESQVSLQSVDLNGLNAGVFKFAFRLSNATNSFGISGWADGGEEFYSRTAFHLQTLDDGFNNTLVFQSLGDLYYLVDQYTGLTSSTWYYIEIEYDCQIESQSIYLTEGNGPRELVVDNVYLANLVSRVDWVRIIQFTDGTGRDLWVDDVCLDTDGELLTINSTNPGGVVATNALECTTVKTR